jgi:E3 ubiquitin-protein ligase HECTD2
MIPTSSFYNTLLDYADLVADFETWESRSSKFSFCQYPFFLSIYAKIHILEYDARRQMESKAREAFFDSILSRKAVSQFLVLKVRRECLVEDSLRSVSEVVGSVQEEVKKGLRIEFVGEEGVDAGGLRKEWFLLLVREVFDPNHGMSIAARSPLYTEQMPRSFHL